MKTAFCLRENKDADQLCSNCAFFLNPKLQASDLLLSLHRLVWFEPGQTPRSSVFSRRGSYDCDVISTLASHLRTFLKECGSFA